MVFFFNGHNRVQVGSGSVINWPPESRSADPDPEEIISDPQNTCKNVIAYLTLLVSDAALLPLPAWLTGALPVLVLPAPTTQQRTRA